ncbi:MAG: extradiol dioxygenase [Gemmatimonadota bacterium]|nr:extradiol dioxygenase [Gemmatimonadota bacterium]
MITGVHTILFSPDAEALRTFFRDTLGFAHVDAGEGWLIFALPPGEVAMHPVMDEREGAKHEMYLMCDDVDAAIEELRGKGVECGEIQDFGFGRLTAISLPDGSEMGLYEPRHPKAPGMDP